MPRKGLYITRKGKPTRPGYEVTGFKAIKLETLESDLERQDKYTDQKSGETLVYERHPNRNPNKPQIDKPRYS